MFYLSNIINTINYINSILFAKEKDPVHAVQIKGVNSW